MMNICDRSSLLATCRSLAAVVALVITAGRLFAEESTTVDAANSTFTANVKPLLVKFCEDCHSDEVAEGDVSLTAFETLSDLREQPNVWLKVREMLRSGQMPPKESPQPNDDERRQIQEWVERFLADEARATAGDPGPVVLRRLTNAEYDFTIHDLTGVTSLSPTREFPVDGAAGEGFTNVGNGQGMSAALVQKYLLAAKDVAAHAVLLPDGIRFSRATTQRDLTDELLGQIQAFYRRYTTDGGGMEVNLDGNPFVTNDGGRLPVEAYFAATLASRKEYQIPSESLQVIASDSGLNKKYLDRLVNVLNAKELTPLLKHVQSRWQSASPEDAPALTAEIARWQQSLVRFNAIGQIGRAGGPTRWMEPVPPVSSHTVRHRLPTTSDNDVVIYLAASSFTAGEEPDIVVWQRPRIEFPAGDTGLPLSPVLLRDVRGLIRQIEATITTEIARTEQYLAALASSQEHSTPLNVVAEERGLNADVLSRWAALTSLGHVDRRDVSGHLPEQLTHVEGYESVNGWGRSGLPSLLTNRADEEVRFLTLTVPGCGVTVHPSPTEESVVAWRSPIDAQLRVEGRVTDTDSACGNGFSWRLELASQPGIRSLAQGDVDNGGSQPFQPEELLNVTKGDVVRLTINARGNDHSCDTTQVSLILHETGGDERTWNLASDIVDRVLEGNPLPDTYGHPQTWHFCTADAARPAAASLLPDSSLARWREAVSASKPANEIDALAREVARVLTVDDEATLSPPDQQLRSQLLDWRGPMHWLALCEPSEVGADETYGLAPDLFGSHPDEIHVDGADLCVEVPQTIEIRLPAELAAGAELVATATLLGKSSRDGSAQVQVLTERPQVFDISSDVPILVGDNAEARRRVDAALYEFRELFPPALCYSRIVPVDEVVTLTLFHREDDHFKRLMLDDKQTQELDDLWDELLFVSEEPLKLVVVYEQLVEFATQDRPDLVKSLAPLRVSIDERAAGFRQRQIEVEPTHLEAILHLADRAWRRSLTMQEQQSLRGFYQQLRDDGNAHDESIRLLLARVLTSPAFLYKLEEPGSEEAAVPVTDNELATRLSYALWCSLPDDELRREAESGHLTRDEVLLTQTRRMLGDERTRRMAIQFACQWLHLRDFDQQNDKNEQLYPEFAELRGAMYEETVRFFEDMFRTNGSLLDLIAADHTFLDESLARHYGIDGVTGDQWQRVAGMRDHGRGGILGMATFLSSQSGASRTSPILRGTWVSETLLGERLPKPPPGIPQLPETVPSGLTARQLIEQHSSAPECAKCHRRIDPYGFALEQFDTIGRQRPEQVDTQTTVLDGTSIDGLEGLRNYLLNERRDDVVRQFCRKLTGYMLGREVQLSDEPLLDQMQENLAANDYRFWTAVEAIVSSRQFRDIRGRTPQADATRLDPVE